MFLIPLFINIAIVVFCLFTGGVDALVPMLLILSGILGTSFLGLLLALRINRSEF